MVAFLVSLCSPKTISKACRWRRGGGGEVFKAKRQTKSWADPHETSGQGIQGYLPHSFQGSFFLNNLNKPRGNGQFLNRTRVEKNGEAHPRRKLSQETAPDSQQSGCTGATSRRFLAERVKAKVGELTSFSFAVCIGALEVGRRPICPRTRGWKYPSHRFEVSRVGVSRVPRVATSENHLVCQLYWEKRD